MARVNKANFRTYRDGETVTASEFNKIKDIFPEAINHIEDTLRDGQRLVDIENVNKEQDERLDSHDEQQAQTDQHLEQLDTRCDEQDEVLADHETRIMTATSENSRQDEVIHNINERLREVEDNNADIKIVTVFANNIQKVETFVASEGQQEFQLQKGHYIPGQNRIQMFVDGVQQTLDDGFMEVGSRTIRFTEPLKAGMKVTAHYFTEEASDDLTDIMETIKEGPAILEGLIQNGESSINGFIQNGENTINGFLAEGEREVEELVTKGESVFDNLVQRAEQVKADSILVQPTKPLPSDNCDIWFDTSEDDFLTLQDYEEARNQAFNQQMATFESRFSEIKGEKGDKGEPGVGVLESDFKDYMGDVHETLRAVHKANVDYTIRTAVGEFNHLDYEGQHITANHSIEGHVKSAILKGNTLVNHINGHYEIQCEAGGYKRFTLMSEKTLPAGKYILIYDVVKGGGSATVSGDRNTPYYTLADGTTKYQGWENFNSTVGKKHWIINTNQEITSFSYWCAYRTEEIHVKDFVLLAYQDGMENWDIPFFTGMRSVKMPVLTTTGKNLFNAYDDNITFSDRWFISDTQIVNENCMSFVSSYQEWSGIVIKNDGKEKVISLELSCTNYEVDSSLRVVGDGVQLGRYINTNGRITNIQIPEGTHVIELQSLGQSSLPNVITYSNIQIEEGSTTEYEPYKSNILTANEEVELGKINNVEDELNLLTGELTQKTTESYINDFTAKWFVGLNKNLPFYIYKRIGRMPGSDFICDKLPVCLTPTINTNYECLAKGNYEFGDIIMYIPQNNITTLDEAVQRLNSYNAKIRYVLNEPTVKTVDLSDNVVYSYDEVTHYDGSSEDGSLIPTLAVKVPTDVNAVISSQRATIQTLEQENQALKKTQDTLLVVQLGMMEHIATTLSESEEQPTYLKALRQLASERGLL